MQFIENSYRQQLHHYLLHVSIEPSGTTVIIRFEIDKREYCYNIVQTATRDIIQTSEIRSQPPVVVFQQFVEYACGVVDLGIFVLLLLGTSSGTSSRDEGRGER